jgi:uncharacterized membrane protein
VNLLEDTKIPIKNVTIETMNNREPTIGQMRSSATEFSNLEKNIQAIIALHDQAESKLTQEQRLIEKGTAWLSCPAFVYLSLVGILSWVLYNFIAFRVGFASFDPPPFPILQDVLSIASFLVTIMILSAENRQGKTQKRQGQLDLQMNLLAEQKITKIIALVEELRRDLPSVKNRHDPEASIMQEATDPLEVLNALEEKLEAGNHS